LVLSDFVVDETRPPGVVLGLHRATHATLQVLSARLAGLDLPASEINVLATLAGHQLLTVGALAAATATRPTTLTSVLDRLARRGYVGREVDPADRRSFLISLTPGGQQAAASVSAAVCELEQAALAGVSPAQRAGFFAVVDALSEVSA
jgi:MarR family transcriptional regulator, organic hydroperoxide resistance regulator